MKKALTYSIVLCLLLFGTTWALATAQDEATAEGPIEISWLGLNATDIVDGNPVQQHLEEKFNVKFVNVVADKQEQEQNILRVAADEHPDAMFTWGPQRLQWYQKGAFRSIPRSMIDEHMPNYVESMNALGAGSWFYGLVPGSSDEYYALPRRLDYQEGTAWLPVFRLDWIEKASHGISPAKLNPNAMEDLAPTQRPGTHMRWLDHFTWDQLEMILTSFAREDLDGNGRNDTNALGGRSVTVHWSGLGLVFYSFGVNEVANYRETDGSTVMDATYSRSKAALETLQRWWQEGLLDPELPATAFADFQTKIIQGQTASFMRREICGHGVEEGRAGDWCNRIVEQGPHPDAKTLVTLMPISPFGDARGRMENPAMPLSADTHDGFVVRHDVSDEKLAKILQIYDYVTFDPVGLVIAHYGIPDQHFTWAGEPYESKVLHNQEILQTGGHYGSYASSQGIRYYSANSLHYGVDRFEFSPWRDQNYSWFITSGGRYNTSERAYREDIFNETRYTELWVQRRGALQTIRDDFFWKAITTDIDIDAEWPKYVQTWMDAGGRELLDEIEKAPLVTDIRAGRVTPP